MESSSSAQQTSGKFTAPTSSAGRAKRRQRRRRKTSSKTAKAEHATTSEDIGLQTSALTLPDNVPNGNTQADMLSFLKKPQEPKPLLTDSSTSTQRDQSIMTTTMSTISPTPGSGVLITTTADIHQYDGSASQLDVINGRRSKSSRRSSMPITAAENSINTSRQKESNDDYQWRCRRQGLRRFTEQAIDMATCSSTTTTSDPTAPVLEYSHKSYRALPNSHTAPVIIPLCNFHCQQIMHDDGGHTSVIGFKRKVLQHCGRHHYQRRSDSDENEAEFAQPEKGNYRSLHSLQPTPAIRYGSDDDGSLNISQRYRFLMSKANVAWRRLRRLPLAAPTASWHQMFLKCFEMYNWLWKAQHTHRNTLCIQLGITRWQVGELAQKIAQLYFNFYVRTSETDFLLQAFKFYNAIREHDYFEYSDLSNSLYVASDRDLELFTSKHLNVLRYLCRLIVTSVLLKKMRLARQIIDELAHLIDIYCTFQSLDDEQNTKWRLVLDNLLNFLHNDQLVNVFPDCTQHFYTNSLPHSLKHSRRSVVLQNRLIHASTSFSDTSSLAYQHTKHLPDSLDTHNTNDQQRPHYNGTVSTFYIEQAIVCGNTSGQIQFGDLQADMFRFMQALEWETSENAASLLLSSSASSSSVMSTASSSQTMAFGEPFFSSTSCHHIRVRAAPRKYMLLRPTFSSFMSTMTHAFNELTPTGILVLYFSCDSIHSGGMIPRQTNAKDEEKTKRLEGLLIRQEENRHQRHRLMENVEMTPTFSCDLIYAGKQQQVKTSPADSVYPSDLAPFLRKPLFLIVDSPASDSFRLHLLLEAKTNNNFFALFPPRRVPDAAASRLSGSKLVPNQYGRLLTLFLYSPCTALCVMCTTNAQSPSQMLAVPLERWVAALSRSHDALKLIGDNFDALQATEVQRNIFEDTFGRMLILRFVFMKYVCQMHCSFFSKGNDSASMLPVCVPALPSTMYDRVDVRQRIYDCAQELDCCDQLSNP